MKALGWHVSIFGTLLLTSSSCVSIGRDFPSDLSWVKEKATNKAEVERTLGEANSVGYSSPHVTWTYQYIKASLFGPVQIKELKFYWKNDIVDSISFNSSFKEDRVRSLSIPK